MAQDKIPIVNNISIPLPMLSLDSIEGGEGEVPLTKEELAAKQQLEAQRAVLLEEIEAQRGIVLAQAAAEAENILADANARSIELLEAARADGVQQGIAEGREQAKEQCARYIQASAQLLSEINNKKEALFKSYENVILETVLEIAKKVMLVSLEKDAQLLLDMLRQAAKGFRNADLIKISLSGMDVTHELVSDLSFLRAVVGETPHIEIELLPQAEQGTCIIDDGREILDASVNTQLEMIRSLARSKKQDKGSH